MRYALCCLLLFVVFSCKQKDEITPEEEEIVVTEEDPQDDDDDGNSGNNGGAASGSDFPLTLSVEQNIPSENWTTNLKMHPSTGGGIYLLGTSSGISISRNANVIWTNGKRGFYESNSKALFTRVINNRDISIFQLDGLGEPQLSLEFPNEHEIDWQASMIRTESNIYFYWLSGQPGLEHVLTIASLNLAGQLNWKKEFDFDQYIYSDLVEHNGQLYIQYGNINASVGLDHVRVATVNDSGDIINDFELKTNLADWNKAEPLVSIQVDDDYIYSNTTKNDYGLNRKSRIAKYTHSGDLVGEIEVLFSKDFYVTDQNIYAIGNDYEVDPDIRRGHPFVIELDENLNVLNNKTFPEIETAWTRVTVSENTIFIYHLLSSLYSSTFDSLYIDTLSFQQ